VTIVPRNIENVPVRDTPVRRPVTGAHVLSVGDGVATTRRDQLATEEPMEIRVQGRGQEPVAFAIAMRTPGNDFELAAGLCKTEGIVDSPANVDTIAYCVATDALERPEQQYNIVTVRLRRPVSEDLRERRYLANSSCGICGKAALDEVEIRCAPVGAGPRVAASTLRGLPERLVAHQSVFEQTGGLHAAARFTAAGDLIATREDVGRHNALDKLIGHAFLAGELPLADQVLLVSGRLSFELVQKAAVAGIPVLCAVSAPSSLAVAAAERFGQTVVGFLRGARFNVYTHADRLDLDA
jgi:FdhD protein